MGYRSEVAYTIRFEDSDKGRQSFNIFLADAKQNEETKGVFEDEHSDSEGDESPLKIDYIRMRINFYADCVKWTPSYSDVKCHDSLILLAGEYIEEQESEGGSACMGYMFYRIGEDMNDIDEEYGGDYDFEWLGVSRSIMRDWE